MTQGYDTFLAASANDRRDAFIAAGRRLGAAEQNIEKDFWVCWTLDAMFNRLPAGGPRLLFKGGTSLSKAFGLISRFSEDIDATVFRDDLGEGASIEALEAMTGKKRKEKLEAIRDACQTHIAGPLFTQLAGLLTTSLAQASIAAGGARVEIDEADDGRQTLLLWYPSVTAATDGYIRPAVKIESGAKSALDPHHPLTIRPYVADDLNGIDLGVPNVTTVDAERTFWDKVVILHGLRRWFEKRDELRGGGQRVSRHYYDLHRLLSDPVAARALADIDLGRDCVRHARMFFNSPDLDLATAEPGSFVLSPTDPMLGPLRRDYVAMTGMIFGDAPAFEAVIASVADLETRLNAAPQGGRPPVG
jgi:hypothetical protein